MPQKSKNSEKKKNTRDNYKLKKLKDKEPPKQKPKGRDKSKFKSINKEESKRNNKQEFANKRLKGRDKSTRLCDKEKLKINRIFNK